MPVAGLDKAADDVGAVMMVSDVGDGLIGRPEAMAGDVLGGEPGIWHAGVAGDADPLLDFEFRGVVVVKCFGAQRELVTEERAEPEVDEHAVLEAAPLREPIKAEALRARFAVRRMR